MYAFGIMIPEIMTGKRWLLSKQQKKDPPAEVPLSGLEPGWLRAQLAEMALRCISVDPDDRPDFDFIAEELGKATVRLARPATPSSV